MRSVIPIKYIKKPLYIIVEKLKTKGRLTAIQGKVGIKVELPSDTMRLRLDLLQAQFRREVSHSL